MGEARMGDVRSDRYAVGDEQAEAVWLLGELLVMRMPGAVTGDRLALVEHRGRRGQASPWHRQLCDDETFYVIDGEVSFWVADPDRPVLRGGRGSTVFVERGTPHAFRVESQHATLLGISTPGGHDRFFGESGRVARGRSLPPDAAADMSALEDACRRHRVEILGPPPGPGAAA
jgi:quercetin dioxygenase-like cupin family protein